MSNIISLSDNKRFINRELSWLSFNERVLNESSNEDYPLLERLRFLSISGNNLDEFHMVRLAGLKKQIKEKLKTISADGRDPIQQLEDVTRSLKSLLFHQQEIWINLKKELMGKSIKVISSNIELKKNKKVVGEIFDKKIFSTLTPLAVDPAHPFPFLPNLSLSLVLSFQKEKGKKFTALLTLPPKLQRFFKIYEDKNFFVKTEKIILLNIKKLFPKFKLENSALLRVIRDSDIEFEEEAEDLMVSFESALKKRRLGSVVGLFIHENCPENITKFLKKNLKVRNESIFKVKEILDIQSLSEIISKSESNQVFKKHTPRYPKRISNFGGDCFAAIKNKEIVVHHPFESFDVVVEFLNQASSDPKVISIKQTLYRTSTNSPIVKALINAANNGKSVTAIVELKARFDEEKNIQWAKDLEKAGVQIVYGFIKLKTHAKISLVSRKEDQNINTYVHYGTGNYHPVTAKVYTDLSYFTCNKKLGDDATKLFNFITGYANPEGLELVSFSPISLRKKLLELIRIEINNANKNMVAEIWIKVNSLIDPEIIDEFYKASNAGVKIYLIIRGICGLRPGIKGLSENIKVKSIIGRYLEHSRIYCFANGKKLPSKDAKVFISSADLMTRNLDRRVETFIPIINKTVHEQIIDQIMVSYIKDNTQSSFLHSDGSYKKIHTKENKFSAHNYFMNNPSLSGSGLKPKSLIDK